MLSSQTVSMAKPLVSDGLWERIEPLLPKSGGGIGIQAASGWLMSGPDRACDHPPDSRPAARPRRRPARRHARRDDIHEAFLTIGCALICHKHLQHSF